MPIVTHAPTLSGLGDIATDEAAHAFVHIPEPMIFDLVRGLGARSGELEFNTLARFPVNRRDSRHTEWAPEGEYAVADGVVLELGLPFEDSELEAYKVAAQFTLGQLERAGFIHGAQFIFENVRHKDLLEFTGLHISGFDSTSAGARSR